MSKEDITNALPFLFAGDSLFFISEASPETEAQPALPLHKGVPEADVHVCVRYPEAEFMPEAEQTLLHKILGAVRVPTENVCIWNQMALPENVPPPQFLLYFGADTAKKYVWEKAQNTQTLFADPLAAISGQLALKKQLWAALQQTDFSAVQKPAG